MDDAQIRARAIQATAAETAPEYRRLMEDWLRSGMLPESSERKSLEQFLWDNKVGVLCVLEHVLSTSPSRSKETP